jgi:hypothetical protein
MNHAFRFPSVRALAANPRALLACALILPALFAAACGNDSATGPSNSVQKITLAAVPTQLPAQGGSVDITATVMSGSDKPMANVQVTFTASFGTLNPSTPVTTDANGQAKVNLTTTGASTVKATSSGVSSPDLQVGVKEQAAITVTQKTADVVGGVSAQFEFTAKRGNADVSGDLTLDWGDGSASQTVQISGTVSVTHAFKKSGVVTVVGTLAESDGSKTGVRHTLTVRDGGGDQIDISNATLVSPMDDRSALSWPVRSKITNVVVAPGLSCIEHTMGGKWPAGQFEPPDGGLVEGTFWIFRYYNGKWYGGVFDYYRPGQTCKGTGKEEYGRDQVRTPPLDAGWIPQVGEQVAFMVSTPGRGGWNTINERSNIVVITWPY